MALGADAMVTSIHKLLPGYTQSSLVCARTERLDRDRLERGFEASHTTSPAGTVLASIDACRALMEARGPELLERLIGAVRAARRRLREELPGLEVPDEIVPSRAASTRRGSCCCCRAWAPTASRSTAGVIEQGLPVELADRDTLVPIVTVADDEATLGALVDVLVPAIRATSGPATLPVDSAELACRAGECR